METSQPKLLELALAGDFEGVKNLFEKNDVPDVDVTDSTGMTALQQAAFRGNYEICKYLLDKGANVNHDKHENSYTTLMFAALSGNEDVVRLILEAGAKTDCVNSVNRTASEMAAFVSQYHIAGVINNYISSSELIRFTKPTGVEEKPKLPPQLLEAFHKLISDSNINPVHTLRNIKAEPGLLENARSIRQVLDKLVLEKMGSHDTHESLSLKLHIISCIYEILLSNDIDAFLKKLSKGRASDGFLEDRELFLRSTLRSFPRPESNLFGMVLQKVSQIKVGDAPTALTLLSNAINGNRMAQMEGEECVLCSARNPSKCTGCYKQYYCDQICQKLHRPTHKKYCKRDPPSSSQVSS